MKRTLIALIAAAALTMPALAQQIDRRGPFEQRGAQDRQMLRDNRDERGRFARRDFRDRGDFSRRAFEGGRRDFDRGRTATFRGRDHGRNGMHLRERPQ